MTIEYIIDPLYYTVTITYRCKIYYSINIREFKLNMFFNVCNRGSFTISEIK